MYKKFLATSFGIAMFVSTMTVASAATIETEAEGELSTEAVEKTIEAGGYYDPGYGSNISFSLYLTSAAKPDKINLSGDFSVTRAESREDAMAQLKKAWSQAEKSLSSYGKVTMISMNAYEDYPYYEPMATEPTSNEKTFSGYLSVKLELSDLSKLEMAKNAITSMNFSHWVESVLNEETKIDIESSLATKLNGLIAKKKDVYEKIIGEQLGKIMSLYIDTWADGSMYNPETGTVPVTVTATVGYSLQ